MERQSLIQDVEVSYRGDTFRSDYFIENGVIHASIGNRLVLMPVGQQSAREAVRTLLLGHLEHGGRRHRLLRTWARAAAAPAARTPRAHAGERPLT